MYPSVTIRHVGIAKKFSGSGLITGVRLMLYKGLCRTGTLNIDLNAKIDQIYAVNGWDSDKLITFKGVGIPLFFRFHADE